MLADIATRMPEWDRPVSFQVLHGGLANRNFLASAGHQRWVVKLFSPAVSRLGLRMPFRDVLHNTTTAGAAGVGARVMRAFDDLPALVLEFLDGRTLTPLELRDPIRIVRLGRVLRRLHYRSAPFLNEVDPFRFGQHCVRLIRRHGLGTPMGMLDALPLIEDLWRVLVCNALPLVPSHNDVHGPNIIDGDEIRLVDFDFSGMSDPCVDLGCLAMEGNYSTAQLQELSAAYFDDVIPVQVARAELYGICANYTWVAVLVVMQHLLHDVQASFDYGDEAERRMAWVSARLGESRLTQAIRIATG